MNPCEFKPQAPEQFIGPARVAARTIGAVIARSKAKGHPIKLLLHGPPGVGKSALCDYLSGQICTDKWGITKLNGCQVKKEAVDDWAARLCFRELGGGYKLLRIEEVDRAYTDAQIRFLTVLDDLPSHCAVLASTNCRLEDLEPRFYSRFQTLHLASPTAKEIARFISTFGVARRHLARISEFCCGNVRLALAEAQTALDEDAARSIL